ncbi:hypothetical protein GCM10023238_22540 [Streptomyces heliomycini]
MAIKEGGVPRGRPAPEVEEETGRTEFEIGSQIWYREAVASWGGNTYDCRERFYLCRVSHFSVDTSGFSQGEIDTVSGHRWWTLDELDAATDRLVPRRSGAPAARRAHRRRPRRARCRRQLSTESGGTST